MSRVRIAYTGGDSNTFIFKVRNLSPAVARNVAQAMVDRLRYVWVTERHEIYSDSLNSIALEIPKAESETTSLKSRTTARRASSSTSRGYPRLAGRRKLRCVKASPRLTRIF